MKKILMSLFTIAIVGALIGGGVIAFFSDVESAPGTFTAGTIDIAISGDGAGGPFENPWTETFTIADAKPCQAWYFEFVIENVGTNPCVVWKTLKGFTTGGGIAVYPDQKTGSASSEPEYYANGGPASYVEVCNIDDWIMYDLYSEVIEPKAGGSTNQWHQTLYTENVNIGALEGVPVPLGSIPSGGKMKVIQSYHLHATTPNDYQGDTLSFTIEFYAKQLEGTTLVMENKVTAQPGEPAVVQFGDGMVGYLDYNTVGSKFNYTFSATGLKKDGTYYLIYYADPWAGNHPGAQIATFNAVGGIIASTSGSVDLGIDLPSSPDDNLLLGAKIWLVPSSDWDGTKMTAYNEPNYLFETYLIWYNDTD